MYSIPKKVKNVPKELEPDSNFNLSEFMILGEVGHGTEGIIYSVKWLKNNKTYALKRGVLYSLDMVQKRQEEIRMLKDFRKRTGSDGVIRIYGDLCVNGIDGYEFYEIMELAEIDWDEEILNRGKYHMFYKENELMKIMKQIVETFSFLQKSRITHRDIKPQNIMIVNGRFKICDFGNARILKKEGYVVQRIRGSEMYMSPVLFRGFHAKMPQVKHNTFKSDVFSLGMCFLLAAALSYSPLNTIREIYDMNIIKKAIRYYLGFRYSIKVYNILFSMLQVDENLRPDFIQLEKMFFKP
jgi:serine/threonine protein kinase